MNTRLQNFLTAENITQSQLADTLGVARASISHIISGRNKPGFDFIESLAKNFPQLNLEWLITGKGKMYGSPVLNAVKTPENAEFRTVTGLDNENSILRESSEDDLFAQTADETPVEISVEPIKTSLDSPVSPADNTTVKQAEIVNTVEGKADSTHISSKKTISQIIIYYDDNTYEVVY